MYLADITIAILSVVVWLSKLLWIDKSISKLDYVLFLTTSLLFIVMLTIGSMFGLGAGDEAINKSLKIVGLILLIAILAIALKIVIGLVLHKLLHNKREVV
ncbi:MAG: hypothetical protein LBK70_00580 [Clostridiales bacterium]|nr:hypothetical protein [Clostridiales bacterium]